MLLAVNSLFSVVFITEERKFLQIKECWDLLGVIIYQGSQLIPFSLRQHVRGSVLKLGNGVIKKILLLKNLLLRNL